MPTARDDLAETEGIEVGSVTQTRATVGQRRAERELFFWTARQVIGLALLAALAAATIVSLAHGEVLLVDRALELLETALG